MVGDYEFTDADIPEFKRWMSGLVAAGMPLFLLPVQAEAARAKGFEEHVHFEVRGILPTALEDDNARTDGNQKAKP